MALAEILCKGMEGEILKACSNTVSSISLGVVLGLIIAVAVVVIRLLKK